MRPPVENAQLLKEWFSGQTFGISGEVQEFELPTSSSSMSLTEYLKIVGQDPDVLEAQLLKRYDRFLPRLSVVLIRQTVLHLDLL